MAEPTDDVYNIDVFQVLLKYEIARCKRYPSPLTLIQIEIIPTALIPAALNAAPLIFSAALSKRLRSSDIPARSGNLFTLLLPNSDKHGGQVVCDRLLSAFKNKFEDAAGNEVTFTLNMGITSHPGGEDITKEVLLERTKNALKQSKQKGPNTYVYLA